MIFVCEARYSMKDDKYPNDENFDSFGRVIERTSAKGFSEALYNFEASCNQLFRSIKGLREYEVIRVYWDEPKN